MFSTIISPQVLGRIITETCEAIMRTGAKFGRWVLKRSDNLVVGDLEKNSDWSVINCEVRDLRYPNGSKAASVSAIIFVLLLL